MFNRCKTQTNIVFFITIATGEGPSLATGGSTSTCLDMCRLTIFPQARETERHMLEEEQIKNCFQDEEKKSRYEVTA